MKTKRKSQKKACVAVRKSKSQKKKLENKCDSLWSEIVRTRDKKCLKCNSIKCLTAHHVFGRRHLATRWDVQNGVTLCYPCHIHWAHRDIGGFMSWWLTRVGAQLSAHVEEKHRRIYKPTIEDLENMVINLENILEEERVRNEKQS